MSLTTIGKGGEERKYGGMNYNFIGCCLFMGYVYNKKRRITPALSWNSWNKIMLL